MTYKMCEIDAEMTPSDISNESHETKKSCSDSFIPVENQDSEMTPPIASDEDQETITSIISNENDDNEEIIIKKK